MASRRITVSAANKYYDLESSSAALAVSSEQNAGADLGLVPFAITGVNGAEVAEVSSHSERSCRSTAAWTDGLKFRGLPSGAHICVKTGRGRYISMTFVTYRGGWPENVETIDVKLSRW